MRPKWIPWLILIAAVLMVLMTLVDKAQAHSRTEMDEWMVDWVIRADTALSPKMFAEFRDMRQRHSWYWDPVIVVKPTFYRELGPNVERWRPLVAEHFAPEKVETALCIMSYESGGNPDAKNPDSSAAGLFQFLQSTWDSVPLSITGGTYSSGQVYVIVATIRAAAWLQLDSGWTQWSPYNRGLCHGL